MTKCQDKLGILGIIFLLGTILTAILHYPLGWGLMDDVEHLYSLQHQWSHLNLLQVLRLESTPVFRPVYFTYSYIFYQVFIHHPKAFYAFNFFFVLASVWPWALLLRQDIPSQSRTRALHLFIFILLAATPLYNLIVYLSLQEKFVICFGGWAFYLLRRAEDHPKNWWRWQTAAWVSILFGLLGKPTTICFIPVGIFALLFLSHQSWLRRFVPAAAWSCVCLVLAGSLLNRHGYTGRYNLNAAEMMRRLLEQPKTFYILVAAGAMVLPFMWVPIEWTGIAPRENRFSSLIWPLSLWSYLAVMVPWGLHTYLWTPAMVLGAGCIVLTVDQALGLASHSAVKLYQIALFASFGVAVFVVFRVGVPRIGRQSEITAVVDWLSARLPTPEVKVYMMEPCDEATYALTFLAGGRQEFTYLFRGQPIAQSHQKVWLITRDECPIDPAHQHEFNQLILQLPHWTVYQGESAP